MSQESFEQFRELVFRDTALQEALRGVADTEQFVALTVRRGAARGYVLTAEDVAKAMRSSRRAWLERWLP